jgi:hypothetical protein
MASTIEPKLAAPGAGLPKAELFVARMLFSRRLKKGCRESFVELFQKERATVRKLVESIDAGAAAKRVLIDRVRGLEDSSRFWSVWMTLEHLRIVQTGIARTIPALAGGHVPPGKASTAAVKPSPDVTGDVQSAFEKSCVAVLNSAAAVADLKTKSRYEHPWFGPLDAFGWLALAGGHLRIHREQIERIIAGLR